MADQPQQLGVISLNASSEGYVQFGRIIEVEVRNFKTKQKITFGNAFRIEFDFFKSIDSIKEASVGQVRIHNLTEKTRKLIDEAGSELVLKFGYGSGSQRRIKRLFHASITKVRPTFQDGGEVTLIDVSANFMEYTFSKFFAESKEYSMVTFAGELVETVLKKQMGFATDNIPEEIKPKIIELLSTKKIFATNSPMSGKEAIDNFCEKHALTYTTQDREDFGDMVIFMIRDEAIPIYNQFANMAYEKITEPLENESDADFNKRKHERYVRKFTSLYITEDKATAFILNQDTGLLGYPLAETEIVTVPENWNIGANEQLTRKGAETLANKAQKEAERKAKYDKAIAEGKKRKAYKAPREGKKQISRTFVRVRALINPSLLPHHHVKIESNLTEYSGVYRVRNIKYTGTNGDGECFMELYCEDSGGSRDSELSKEQQEQVKQDAEIVGSLGSEEHQENVTVEGFNEE